MCRHFAWLGRPRTLADLVFGPSYGLPQQAARPRWQREGIINTDGFGVGWYPVGPAGSAPRALRYRRTGPIWADGGFRVMAEAAASGCVLGAVRSATPGMPVEEAATAPFTDGRHLLSHNGHLDIATARPLLAPGRVPESSSDSPLLAAILWQRLEHRPLSTALVDLVGEIVGADEKACMNVLATDGERIVATVWGETLCYREEEDGVLVASEPHDDGPWTTVPDRSVLFADPMSVNIKQL